MPEQNARGNTVYRNEEADARLGAGRGSDRYFYDFKALKSWKQYDTHQDAWYFGMWVDLVQMRTFTYCEGDRTLVECPTPESFRAELADAAQFYGDPPPAAVGFDMDGTRTEYYDTRPTGSDEELADAQRCICGELKPCEHLETDPESVE